MSETGIDGGTDSAGSFDTGKVEIFVIGGWLGSGKTTFLNRLLAHRAETFLREGVADRVAILVNDVGDVHLDPLWIKRRDAQSIELLDGCICCSIGDSLAVVLRDLVLGPRPPRTIFIEASGLAQPAKVAQYGDRRRVEVLDVLVTVDVVEIERRLADATYGRLAQQQLLEAGRLILTKTDLVTESTLERTRAQLKEQFDAEICEVSEALRLTLRPELALEPSRLTSDGTAEVSSSEDGSKGDGEPNSVHAAANLTWRSKESLATDQLPVLLEELGERGALRVKGICRDFTGDAFVLQLAGGLVSRELFTGEAPEESSLVVIYDPERLDLAAIDALLKGALAKSS